MYSLEFNFQIFFGRKNTLVDKKKCDGHFYYFYFMSIVYKKNGLRPNTNRFFLLFFVINQIRTFDLIGMDVIDLFSENELGDCRRLSRVSCHPELVQTDWTLTPVPPRLIWSTTCHILIASLASLNIQTFFPCKSVHFRYEK